MSDEFPFVDFFHKPAEGERRVQWKRMPTGEVRAAAAAHKGIDCYVTVQTFSEVKAPDHADSPELHFAPPYADFDSDDLSKSQADMLKLVRFATEELDLTEDDVRVWFSGKKGFHVLLNPKAFAVHGDQRLTYVYKRMFAHLAAYLDIPTLDQSVYSKRRMWRMENSVHGGSGLHKVRLDHDDITEDEEGILFLAQNPRDSMEPWPDSTNDVAATYLARFWEEYEAAESASKHAPSTLNLAAAPGDPVCVQDIEGNGIKKPGDRNKATVVMATYYKDAGRSLEDARANITDWALRLPAEHRKMDAAYIRANTRSVVDSVYADEGYKFGCSFIRSLHGPKKDRDYERVACMGEDCPFVKVERAPETVHDIHLSEIGNPDYIDKPVRTNLRIAGRLEQPFLVPRRVTLRATTDECDRGACSLHSAGGTMIKDFSTDPRMLIAMCGINDAAQRQVIRESVQKGNCKNFVYETLEYIRVIELAAVPKAESAIGTKGELSVGNYTFQRAYALGDESDFPVNSYYEVTGKIHAHPRNQHATLFITGATPLADLIEDFDLDSVRPLFKVYEDMPNADATLGHMISDLGVNVAKVAGRKTALMGLLMTMHAPLYLDIETERYGGWMQTLVVGDTGEAKSQLVERVLRHVGLGDLVNAQNAGRTGLLYTIVNKDAMMNFIQWGAFVLNDRRLLVIDEASGLEKAEYAELRNARRDGVFKVSRSVTGEAQTRTRLIMLSNPRYGKNMGESAQGIEAVTQLFENADIRRFDLVIGFKAGSVSHDQIDKELSETVEHLFTSEVLRANMLWAWSRKPEDVVWAPGTLDEVKAAAKRLNATYAGSGLHLLSQDAVEKVARMAQALAAMLHSTDPTHRQIIVTPAHSILVEEMLSLIYSSPDLEFDSYVRQNREDDDLDYDKLAETIDHAISRHGPSTDEVLHLFARTKVVNTFAIEAICGDPKLARAVSRELFKLNLIKAGRNGYERTLAFNEYLRRWHRKTAIL